MTDRDKNQLQNVFGEHVEKLTEIEYRHPAEDTVLSALRDIIHKSPTAEHLLHITEQYNIPVYLLKNKEVQGFALEGKTVFLSMPETSTTPSPALVLEFVAAMREIEQELIGYKRPPVKADPLEFAAMSHAKNLDIIVHMCKTAHELSGGDEESEYIQTIELMGHGGLYDAYVRDFSAGSMVQSYYGQ